MHYKYVIADFATKHIHNAKKGKASRDCGMPSLFCRRINWHIFCLTIIEKMQPGENAGTLGSEYHEWLISVCKNEADICIDFAVAQS